jgi:transcriptional regulator with XRE-family HTH domain
LAKPRELSERLTAAETKRMVRKLRKLRGWTQGETAAALGVSPMAVNRWERGVCGAYSAIARRIKALYLASPVTS